MIRILILLRRRALQAIPILLGIAVVNFLLLQMTEGTVVDALVGQMGAGDPELVARMTERFGLDRPVWEQLLRYLRNLIQLDLGQSHFFNMPVRELIFDRMGATLLLMISSIFLAAILGTLTGVAAARRYNTIWDRLMGVLALLLYATPVFWLGLMAIVVFSVKLNWLPIGGMFTIGANFTLWESVRDVLWHLMLPMVTLSAFFIATYTRLMRSSMLEAMHQDYARTARAKGMTEARVAYRHVVPNALLPIVTVIGVQMGAVLGGAVVVESVFTWPGLGRLAFDAVLQRDLNLLMGILFMCSVLVICINFVVDVIYGFLDPRMELR